MQKLVILSDIWGNYENIWVENYIKNLEKYFEIQFYDSSKLAQIDTNELNEKKIHNQFIDFGIDKAVENLIKLETSEISILGFSIGGLIGWKATLLGLKVNQLFAISSTRLRFENNPPSCKIQLFFGENDPNKPNSQWFDSFKLYENIFKKENHDFYKKDTISMEICNKIIPKTHIK
jgi:hypothetical protein